MLLVPHPPVRWPPAIAGGVLILTFLLLDVLYGAGVTVSADGLIVRRDRDLTVPYRDIRWCRSLYLFPFRLVAVGTTMPFPYNIIVTPDRVPKPYAVFGDREVARAIKSAIASHRDSDPTGRT
jgi:hypothetical protein